MRASRSVGSRTSRVRKPEPVHVSGAEGIYEASDVEKIVRGYAMRAMNHSRGMPDEIVITVEKIKEDLLTVPFLSVSTVISDSPLDAQGYVQTLLTGAGISKKAIRNGLKVVTAKEAMRGASLVRSVSGIRAEPDRVRGVRVSRLGMEKALEKNLSRRLAKRGINTITVKEAVTLASKVASCLTVIAELCVSDDPDYTTGYIASRSLGYVRIPNIKQAGSLSGGRVLFIAEGADVSRTVEYLERTPVIVVT